MHHGCCIKGGTVRRSTRKTYEADHCRLRVLCPARATQTRRNTSGKEKGQAQPETNTQQQQLELPVPEPEQFIHQEPSRRPQDEHE